MGHARHALPAGSIRELAPADLRLFCDHLLRLDPASRHDRFNGITDDEFVRAYAARCFGDDVAVLAFEEDGMIRGAAELHEVAPGRREVAELAFSVEEAWQHRGIGSRLFSTLLTRAAARGCRELIVTTHPRNEAMKALARRFGARLSFQNLETVGVIDLTEPAAIVRHPVGDVPDKPAAGCAASGAMPKVTPTAPRTNRVVARR